MRIFFFNSQIVPLNINLEAVIIYISDLKMATSWLHLTA